MNLRSLGIRAQLGLFVMVVALVLLAVGLVVSLQNGRAAPAAADVGPVEPISGAWSCPVGDGRSGTELTVTAARPDHTADGEQGGSIVIDVNDDGEVTDSTAVDVLPNEDRRLVPEVARTANLSGRWEQAPVSLSREWRLDGGGLPPGIVTGPCVQPFGEQWIVPGLTTVGSERAFIRLANPFAADATVVVSFLTPEGREDPLALQNLTVPARSTVEILVNDYLPERADLSAIVEVAAGRIAAEGFLVLDTEIGDVQGATLLAAAPAAGQSWTLPWVVDDEETASWLWVANPGDSTATVELTLHTPAGGGLLEALSAVEVPPGVVRRVDLRDALPDGVQQASLTARSEGVDVVISMAVLRVDEEPEDTGFAITLGAPSGDAAWVVSGGEVEEGRREELRIVNPSGEPATVDVSIFDGNAIQRPDAFQDVAVPPGAAVRVPLVAEIEGLAQWTAMVRADQDVVVGRVGAGGEEQLDLVSVLGQPSNAWRPPVRPLAGEAEDGLVVRMQTSLGLQWDESADDSRADDPLRRRDPDAPDEQPTPPEGPDGSEPLPEDTPADVDDGD